MRGRRRAGSRPHRDPLRAVRVEARAKLNLGLAVGPRRADGFHEIATVFQSISLSDTLLIRRRAHGFSLRVRFEPQALSREGARGPARPRSIPRGGGNLILRAARLMRDRVGLTGGASFELIKRIPIQAGLGGGSADAAATLVGLATLYGVRLRPQVRGALAAELGSDVPFALSGGTALGLGRGERIRPLTLAGPFRALIVVPRWGISTAQAYRRIDRGKYGLTAWTTKLRFAQSLGPDAVRPMATLGLGNTFESALGKRARDFRFLCGRLRVAGLNEPRLTGSGSAVFGILDAGRSVKAMVARFEGTEEVYSVHSMPRALRVIRLR